MTIFDYLDKNKYSFIEKEFNEIDNLIFSRLIYLKFEDFLDYDDKITIEEAYKKFLFVDRLDADKDTFFDKATIKIFEKMAKSKRFKNIVIGNYFNDINRKLEKQFAAITFYLPNNFIYVSFRGTDDTLVALKEDFNMSYMLEVPSQKESVKYLEKVASENKFNIIVGGHSKGGNLAMYSAIFCKHKYKKRIAAIYNNDGPGFLDEILDSKNYKKVVDKIHTFIPQTSIIGMLLNHREKISVVKSDRILIMQHDPDSWYIDLKNNCFVKLDSISKQCKYIDDIMNDLLLIPVEEKKKFFDIMYQIMTSTGAITVKDFYGKKIQTIKSFLAKYNDLSETDKEFFVKIWKNIIKVAKLNMENYLPKKKIKEKKKKQTI